MNNFKKYIAWFIVWILSMSAITYAAWNWTIGDLFVQVWTQWKLVWDNIQDNTVDNSKLKDETVESSKIKNGTIIADDLADSSIWSWKLIDNTVSSNVTDWDVVWNTCNWMACVWYCLNTSNDIVWMKWMNNTENYDECIDSESGSLMKIITYYK